MAKFTFVFVEMGQGDCTMVKCPDGKIVVVDCGYTTGVWNDPNAYIEAYLLLRTPEWAGGNNNKINALILTHPDADHHNKVLSFFNAAAWNGAITLPSNNNVVQDPTGGKINIDAIYISSAYGDDSPMGNYTGGALGANVCNHYFGTNLIYEFTINNPANRGNFLRRWIKADNFNNPTSGGQIEVFLQKMSILSGNTGGQDWKISVIAGNVPKGYGNVQDGATEDNAKSLITLFEVGNRKALLCGDATLSTERFLLDAHTALIQNVDLVMVPHHGSAYASGQNFVQNVNPIAGVVSVGFLEHSYRLPRYTAVLERWLECIEARNAADPLLPHDIDYWYACTDQQVTDKYNEWTNNNTDLSRVDSNPSGNFWYLKNPVSGSDYGIYRLLNSGMLLFRENVTSHLTMTAQKTQVYELSENGVVYL